MIALCRIGGYKWKKFKEELVKKRGNRCEKCGKFCIKLIADHKIPLFLGGKEFSEKNVQLLCEKCNKKKTHYDLSISSWLNKKK